MGTEALSSREIIGMFYQALEQGAHPWANDLAFRNQSANQGVPGTESYKWLGQAPAPREWLGGRNPMQLRQTGYDIANKRWESSIEVPVLDWTKDKTPQIQARVRDLATRYGVHVARLLSTLMINGEATACYDGQYFFDTDHSEGASGSQSNDLSIDISALAVPTHGSTTAPSVDEAAACVMQAISAILGFKDDRGEPMNEESRDFRIIAPVSLWAVLATAVGAPNVSYASPNVVQIATMDGYRVRVHANARLTWTAQFAVFRGDGIVKPFIYQEDGGVNTKILGPDSEYATINDRVLVTTDAINNAGYGYWQHACLVTMT